MKVQGSAFAAVLLICCCAGLSAQDTTDERPWRPFKTVLWGFGPAYPEGATVGTMAVIGQSRRGRVRGRGGSVRGLAAGMDTGPGGLSMRAGWAHLFAFDAGYDGWSFEAVYTRPWVLQWGLDRNASYIGAGLTRYAGWLRMSGALVMNASTRSNDLGASIKLGLLLPLD